MTDTAFRPQRTPTPASNGSLLTGLSSNIGELFTQGWKQELVNEGRVFSTHVGSLSAGADIALITGGGNGTTIDSDQPEAIVGVAANTVLIPLYVEATVTSDMDANADQQAVLLFADLTQAPPSSATATAPTPINLNVNSGVTSGATVYTAVTADITDPVMSQLLMYRRQTAIDNGTAASAHVNELNAVYNPELPFRMAGPCSLVLCFGGTVATTGMATIFWAEVPSDRYNIF